MTVDPDLLHDRRRLKRRLAMWRLLAIVAVAAGIVAAFARFDGAALRDHVARLDINGLVVADPVLIEAIDAVAEDQRAKALIVRIDSPGGTFVGGETIYRALRRVAAEKPVVAVMSTLATSGGYMVAIAADRIFALEGTVTGSIGVILQTADVTGLLGKLGVKAEAIKSAPLKAVPSPLEPLTDEARAATQAVIDDLYGRFMSMVAERRGYDEAGARAVADGRIYTGRQALENGLIDEIGDEIEARRWLDTVKNVAEDLPLEDVEIDYPSGGFLAGLGAMTRNISLPERLILDGVVSVWHPSP